MMGATGQNQLAQLTTQNISVEEWKSIATTFREPLARIMDPLQVLLKAKLNTDPEGRVLQEELQSMGQRKIEGAVKLLSYLLDDKHHTEADIAVRWQMFGSALQEVHPVLYEIITGNCQEEIQAQQKALIDHFTDDISMDVDPSIILPSLVSNGLLGQIERDRLQSIHEQSGPTLSAIYMVCNIHRVNPNWYSIFLGVLLEHGYHDLVRIVDPDSYDKKLQQLSGSRSAATPTGAEDAVLRGQDAVSGDGSTSSSPVAGASGDHSMGEASNKASPPRSSPSSPGCDVSDSHVQSGIQSRGNEGNSDEEEEEDAFHSCDSSFDGDENSDLGLTKVKEVESSAGLDESSDLDHTQVKVASTSDLDMNGDLTKVKEVESSDLDDNSDLDLTQVKKVASSSDLGDNSDLNLTKVKEGASSSLDDSSDLSHTKVKPVASSSGLNNTSDLSMTEVKGVTTIMAGDQNSQVINKLTSRQKVSAENLANQQSNQTAKELRDKNISFPDEEIQREADNSNAEQEPSPSREESEEETYQLYDDQQELAEKGLAGKNVIIISPTGSGKTYVALEIIKNHLEQRGPGEGKVVFLVNNRALAEQQYRQYFKKYLGSSFRIKLIVGGDGKTTTEHVPFSLQLRSADVLVMTAQILHNALVQKEIAGIQEFSLVVFDECHHTQLNHIYNCIMHRYMDLKFQEEGAASATERVPQSPVQVVGLTASVGVGKAQSQAQAELHVMTLCAHLDTEYLCTVQKHIQQLLARTSQPRPERITCQKRPDDEFEAMIVKIMQMVEDRIERSEYVASDSGESVAVWVRLKTNQRGSCQYTTWITELYRIVTLLPDSQACRELKPCCDMLKIYNNALIINDECDTQDALDYLDQQMTSYDPAEQRNTHTEIFLKELFDKNKPYLDNVSKLQANRNPKLLALEEKIVKTFENNKDSRAVVFVQTRELADALLRWLCRRPWLSKFNVKPEKMVGACASAEKGGMTDTQQREVLNSFREGTYNVLVATSIAEEGLHFPRCNLVLLFNHITNEIAVMQARGRARAEDSEFVTVAGENKGVEQKAQELEIKEMMMHEAVRQVQAFGGENHEEFLQALQHIQATEKRKRDAELSSRRERLLQQGEMEFRCVHCDNFAFMLSDVRRIDNTHYVVIDLDYRHRHTERLYSPTLLGRVQNIGRLSCGVCDQNWGPVQIYCNLKFACIKLESFRYADATGVKKAAKKWKKTGLVIEEITDEELEQYRTKATLIGYTSNT